ncbi:MAG: glycosyltransferase, partial [Ktedonobacterales bacterium]|nr:glycosyltransferase [Ktedonobacterales bacterium]
MSNTPPPFILSIVIPTFNEIDRLPQALDRIHAFLVAQGWLATTEVIVADDGSRDGTGALAARYARTWPHLVALLLAHQGKGAAVRQGMLAARGDFVFFCDVDLSMPIEQLVRFLPPLAPAAEIIIASREAPGARRYGEPRYRHIMGRVFNALVRLWVFGGIA